MSARCSICGTLIAAGAVPHTCTECQQDYHLDCWNEIGGCATYGCKSAAVAEKPPAPVVVGAGWGDQKACPSCGHSIASSLLVCRCGATFPYADPMTRGEYLYWKTEQEELSTSKMRLVGLFIASLLGFPAPIAGPIAGIYAWKKREQLAGPNGTFLAVGYGAAGLGLTYTVILILLALGA